MTDESPPPPNSQDATPAPPPALSSAAPPAAAEATGGDQPRITRMKAGALAAGAGIAGALLSGVGGDAWGGVKAWFTRNDLVSVNAELNPDRIQTKNGPLGGFYVLDRPVENVGAPPNNADNCVGRYEWAIGLGAATADTTGARISVRAKKKDTTVELTDIRTVDVQRAAPPSGTSLVCAGRGGQPDKRIVNIDLDATPPTIQTSSETGEPIPFLFTVGHDEYEIFDVTAQTVTCSCQWRLQIVARYDGRTETITIPPRDQPPFRTVSSASSKTYRWQNGTWTLQHGPLSTQPTPTPPVGPPVGTGPPATQQIPFDPDTIPACRILKAAEVDAALGRRAQPVSGFSTDGAGAPNPIRESHCTYTVDPSPAPPPNQPHDGLNISRATATSVDAAKAEVAKRLPLYANGQQTERVPNVGDEAYYANGTFLVRHGAEFLFVGISTQDSGRQRRVIDLGRTSAKRVWG